MSTWGSYKRDLFSISVYSEQSHEDGNWGPARYTLNICGLKFSVTRASVRRRVYAIKWHGGFDVWIPGLEFGVSWVDLSLFWCAYGGGDEEMNPEGRKEARWRAWKAGRGWGG